ncbi:penicillin-binding protein 2 [Litorivivens lipolytica]|uniref:Peptidoglycan D,D-transpeptidase MrdA n=1 Tax=Litorivivens lipolytica TaxID=1524264 RepID=A0A7W4W5G7_9GAMM|nr:penicillin-binding protein 2 [Litorivivens lipolytica]MBB3047187.1 penicillin-binding protein 2 [Litorivivens lipolytica]
MPPLDRLKDPNRERRLFGRRYLVAIVLIGIMLGIICGRYFYLQVIEHELYQVQSDRNRIQLQPIPPKRGLIYDRNGVLLAENIPSYSLVLIKERVPDVDATLSELAAIIDIDEDDIRKFKRRLRHRRPYQAVPLKLRLTEEEIARFAVNRYRLPGVDIDAQLIRYYPQGELLAHVLGYVGRINEREMEEIDTVNYSATNYIGKLGVEKFYEESLHGTVGYQNVETNARGRVLRVLERHPPIPGADLVLNIDVELQKVAHEILGNERGAIVAIDPADGGVLAMVSTPSYDINLFVNGISSKDYKVLRESPDLPLFNRTLLGQYPPASTLKPILGLGALHYGVVTRRTTVYDPGWFQLPNDERVYRDWKTGGHGNRIDLHQAIVESCDVYFYDMAVNMGIDRIHEFGTRFGLGERTGIDIDNERAGLLPSREWKREVKGSHWFPGETVNVGIGQGFMLTTPMQLAVATAVLANRGERKVPRIVRTIDGFPVQAPIKPKVEIANDSDWDYIRETMEGVVHEIRGTAKNISNNLDYRIAGKTGTAQVIGIVSHDEHDPTQLAKRQRDHALFVGFAPADNPTIALAVIVENGEAGGRVAAPIARRVFDAYLRPDKVKPKAPVKRRAADGSEEV